MIITREGALNMFHIMVVEDDLHTRRLMQAVLEQNGYSTIPAGDGEEALEMMDRHHVDLILLDVMMPRMDGLQLTRRLREEGHTTPILMLTARETTQDKCRGFLSGADDYVVKPFEAKEVVARIKAVLRRFGKNGDDLVKEVHYDKLSINLTNYELKVNGKVVDTPPKEMELIYHLASNPNRVFTRDQLLDEVWGFDYYGDSRTVDVHVKRLREKLEGVSDKWALKTVWGVGYKFEVKE